MSPPPPHPSIPQCLCSCLGPLLDVAVQELTVCAECAGCHGDTMTSDLALPEAGIFLADLFKLSLARPHTHTHTHTHSRAHTNTHTTTHHTPHTHESETQ